MQYFIQLNGALKSSWLGTLSCERHRSTAMSHASHIGCWWVGGSGGWLTGVQSQHRSILSARRKFLLSRWPIIDSWFIFHAYILSSINGPYCSVTTVICTHWGLYRISRYRILSGRISPEIEYSLSGIRLITRQWWYPQHQEKWAHRCQKREAHGDWPHQR